MKWCIPKAELATLNISTVFKAWGLCLAFSFLLTDSTCIKEDQLRWALILVYCDLGESFRYWNMTYVTQILLPAEVLFVVCNLKNLNHYKIHTDILAFTVPKIQYIFNLQQDPCLTNAGILRLIMSTLDTLKSSKSFIIIFVRKAKMY